MKVQIIVDSTVDMPEHSRSACRVVPLTVHFGEESFIDGVTLLQYSSGWRRRR